MLKKKIIKFSIIIFVLILGISFVLVWKAIDGNYDKQNKAILFLKSIIPTHLSRKIRDTIFIIPDLKTQNKELLIQVKKFEQGYEGNLFREKNLTTDKTNYNLKEFFLPFPRLDVRNGYYAEVMSKRAHYLEIVDDKIICISGLGEIIFFQRENLLKKKLNQKTLKNNLLEILKKSSSDLVGIRDLYYENEKIYLSMISKSSKGFTIDFYSANLNFEKLNFEIFFEINEFWQNYNVFSGGRIERFDDDKILLSIGFSKEYQKPQDKNSLLGKIIAVNKSSKKFEIMSMGHRNPQGLFFYEKKNLIINTEHGPKGGDEINFNFLKKNVVANFGWPEVSYGEAYPGEEKLFKANTFKAKHSELGFIEPFDYFVPAIGISEVIFLDEKHFDNKHNLFVASLRAGSIYLYEVSEGFNKIISKNRLNFGNERIRDMKYDKENNILLLLLELTPSIGVLKLN